GKRAAGGSVAGSAASRSSTWMVRTLPSRLTYRFCPAASSRTSAKSSKLSSTRTGPRPPSAQNVQHDRVRVAVTIHARRLRIGLALGRSASLRATSALPFVAPPSELESLLVHRRDVEPSVAVEVDRKNLHRARPLGPKRLRPHSAHPRSARTGQRR